MSDRTLRKLERALVLDPDNKELQERFFLAKKRHGLQVYVCYLYLSLPPHEVHHIMPGFEPVTTLAPGSIGYAAPRETKNQPLLRLEMDMTGIKKLMHILYIRAEDREGHALWKTRNIFDRNLLRGAIYGSDRVTNWFFGIGYYLKIKYIDEKEISKTDDEFIESLLKKYYDVRIV